MTTVPKLYPQTAKRKSLKIEVKPFVDKIFEKPITNLVTELRNTYSNDDAQITKEDIFHYTYAVLHHPAYRKKYELNLKREFPRIPFYDNFPQWVRWGQQLMELHVNYESVQPYPLTQHNFETKTETKNKKKSSQKLKSLKHSMQGNPN